VRIDDGKERRAFVGPKLDESVKNFRPATSSNLPIDLIRCPYSPIICTFRRPQRSPGIHERMLEAYDLGGAVELAEVPIVKLNAAYGFGEQNLQTACKRRIAISCEDQRSN
jgi:hypothetical protein